MDVLKRLKSLAGLATWSSHFDTLGNIIARILGRNQVEGSPPAVGAPPVVKGRSGFGSWGDERKWLVFLEAAETHSPGAAKLLTDFWNWADKYDGPSWLARSYIKLIGSFRRTLIVEMGSSEGAECGSKTTKTRTTRKEEDGESVVVEEQRTEKLHIAGTSNPKQLFLRMAKIIRENQASDTARGRLRGYKACRQFLHDNWVPFPDQKIITLLERLETGSKESVATLWSQALEIIGRTDTHMTFHLSQWADDAEVWSVARRAELPIRRAARTTTLFDRCHAFCRRI